MTQIDEEDVVRCRNVAAELKQSSTATNPNVPKAS